MKLNSASNELFQLLEELSQSVLVHHKGPALTSVILIFCVLDRLVLEKADVIKAYA